ncbi:hypothetical protein ACFVXC_02630 [Streptomyces sp. NPDC058257]|uniref:hypothetical protein n=1 Tax=Streptomyces sp. NPDC058257 TaxID=3346409 RepID=UPI0036E4E0EA
MLDEEHGAVFLVREMPDDGRQVASLVGRHPGGGLVQEQYPGRVRHRARQFHHAGPADGESPRAVLGEVLKSAVTRHG